MTTEAEQDKHRDLRGDELRFLGIILSLAPRIAGRVQELQGALQRIAAEDKSCERCGDVAEVWKRVEPDFRILTHALEALAANSSSISLAARLLEMVEED